MLVSSILIYSYKDHDGGDKIIRRIKVPEPCQYRHVLSNNHMKHVFYLSEQVTSKLEGGFEARVQQKRFFLMFHI